MAERENNLPVEAPDGRHVGRQGPAVPEGILRRAVQKTPFATDGKRKCWGASCHAGCTAKDCKLSHQYIEEPIDWALEYACSRWGNHKSKKKLTPDPKVIAGYQQAVLEEAMRWLAAA